MSTKRPLQNALSLAHFIRRQKVLNMYRQFFRLIRKIEDPRQKIDLQNWVKSEFATHKHTTDKELIEIQLSNGLNALRDLETFLRHAHALKS